PDRSKEKPGRRCRVHAVSPGVCQDDCMFVLSYTARIPDGKSHVPGLSRTTLVGTVAPAGRAGSGCFAAGGAFERGHPRAGSRAPDAVAALVDSRRCACLVG